MATIIAAGFETYEQSQAALARLAEAGVNDEYVCEFAVNPPGMHDRTPIGGDHDKSEGAQHAHGGATKGLAAGAVVGAIAGVAATPLMGPAGVVAGAGVGAYTGSLIGGMKGGVDQEVQPDDTIMRPAETLIAVNADMAGIDAERIVRLFEECGAWQVERAEGTWAAGEWKDFDPVTPPHLVGGRDPGTGVAPAA
jgi:hypothetical protein